MDALDISKPAANIVWNISSKYKTAKKHNSVLVQHVCWPCIHVHLTIGTTTHTSSMQTLLYFTHVGQHFRYPSISFDVSLITWHTMTLLEISSISFKKNMSLFQPSIGLEGIPPWNPAGNLSTTELIHAAVLRQTYLWPDLPVHVAKMEKIRGRIQGWYVYGSKLGIS